ncbi:protease pro-enzyme activation domain-containing protein [Telmatobacter sp. DSM 110680]|uniref:Protease pro-enzyme activation domain-containing protein n=1 Tax=Telmatobacter sp. DSM 110680 TaxID=3036704 RepID=A0AAU7DNK7_9BACT
MITKLLQGQKMLRACGFSSACALATIVLAAQTPAARIASEVNVSQMSLLKGSQHPLAQAQYDAGRMPADTQLKGMSIVFNRSAAQQADLEALIAAQQNPASPLYHQWLTPDQFAARFGMAQSDIDKVQTWLQQQGFSVDSVARSRNLIRFSGNAGQVEQAFQTQMHYYNVRGEKHFAPATALSLPSAVLSSVATVGNLDDFRPRPMHIRSDAVQPRANFTSGVSGSVYLAPGDVKMIYDLNPLLSASINGTGQSIAILGQSSVVTSDLESFQNAAKLTVKDPTMVIVPGSGGSQLFSGDESESDLDLEWSDAIAPGADVFFVYTGGNSNFGVFDSLQYAVDEKIANIISISYGACEPNISAANITTLDAILAQGVAQGQTIVAASGDAGSTACYQSPTTTNPPLTTQEAIAVSYPASSQYVTGVGGTEISQANTAYYTQGQGYWTAETSGTDILTSALQYIPEVVWNDDALAVNGGNTSLSAGGGGVSTIYKTKPSWQTGVPGIPSDNARDVPDISLLSSPAYVPYIYCSSDSSAWSTGQTASCSNNTFRDSATQDLTLAGGTSFATPIFAGMVAILNQQKGYNTGQGLLNTELYKLAANSATYAGVFHDITSGNNACPSSLGTSYCTGSATTDYSATTGYDLATGLGSFDLDKLTVAWPLNTGTALIATTTTVSAASATLNPSTNDVVTITVARATGSGTPTGTVNLSIDGSGSAYGATGSTTTPVTLSGGTATYTANFSTCGVHTIVAQYAGDATDAPSTGSVTLTVGGSSCGFALALTPATLTVKQGSQGSETVTVTPSSGYTGTVNLSYVTSNDTALANLCVFAGTGLSTSGAITVGSTAASGAITFDTNAADCASTTGAVKAKGLRVIPHGTGSVKPSKSTPQKSSKLPIGMAFGGLLLAGFLGRSSRKLRQVACVIALASLGLVVSACGGTTSNTGGTTITDPAKGTYTITFTGTDSVTSTVTAQSSFSLVIN